MGQPTSRVIILGAGASAFAEYPLARDVLDFVQRRCQRADPTTKTTAGELIRKLRVWGGILRNQIGEGWDLETFLSVLELTASSDKPGKQKRWTETDRWKLARAITYAFEDHQVRLKPVILQASWSEGHEIKDVATRWANWIELGDTIISFNWDVLHEVIPWRAAKWSYLDGYGFRCPNASSGIEASAVRILKLHGSVNWVQEDEMQAPSLAFVDEFFPEKYPRTNYYPPISPLRDNAMVSMLDSGRKLILPTYFKDIPKNRALLNVWCAAQEALRTAKEIWVVGFSLNPADHPARFLLATELTRNTQVQTVSIVDPRGVGEWAPFLQLAGKEPFTIQQTMCDWLRSIPLSDPFNPYPKSYSRFEGRVV
ncbi:MAG: hypothetical protein KGM47_09845 [Acidobacteriota bacterium]|nr:hypothetical protein [Acidobacteriota bacterium]